MKFKTIEWQNNKVVLIDQRKLPGQEIYNSYSTYEELGMAIKEMVVRGAPAIGVAAAMGFALGAYNSKADNKNSFFKEMNEISDFLFKTRPTAVNLSWALNEMKSYLKEISDQPLDEIKQKLVDKAIFIRNEDEELCKQIGNHGQVLFEDGDQVLTHCNAGALATAGFGTALGVIYAAHQNGKVLQVYADETRPFLQGARLTAWELHKNKIPVKVISDNMAGYLMSLGKITKVIVGADRIAANGDVCNKIGTYTVAVLAKRHHIPFYVAAPLSTIDLSCESGEDIPIEERTSLEVTHIQGIPITPEGVEVVNPAFDVTPNDLVEAIVTEKGVVCQPYSSNLKGIFK